MKQGLFKKIGLTLMVLLIGIQFIQIHPNQNMVSNANHITNVVTTNPDVAQILKTSCYDCHSNHTNYPWYSYIQPIGFWLNHHVNEGKEEFNLDEFATYKRKKQIHKLEETIEMLDYNEMPLSSYTLMHANAKLTPNQKQRIINWAKLGINQLSDTLNTTK